MTSEHRTKQFRIPWGSPILIGVVLVLALAELALRVPSVYDRLPEPNPYYDIGVETRLRALRAVRPSDRTIDVLFVGSSVVRTNIDPELFDRLIADHGGPRLVSFNGGFSALHPDLVRLYLERFWFDHVKPRIVVQAVRFEELHSDVQAETWYRFKEGRFERWWVRDGLLDRLQAVLYRRVRLLYDQGLWDDRLMQGWTPGLRVRDFPITPTGFGPTSLTLTEARDEGKLPPEPPVYHDAYQPDGFRYQLDALAQADSTARAHGARYVLVNMPEHCARYQARDGLERYRAYLSVLGGFAADHGIPLIDVTDGDPDRFCADDWFSDYHHMSPQGARVFTTMLARRFRSLAAAPARGRRVQLSAVSGSPAPPAGQSPARSPARPLPRGSAR